jgi:HSP20 family protein
MERLSDGPLAPALDLYTTPQAVVAKVALPGVKPEDVDLTIGEGLVTISASVRPGKGSADVSYIHRELDRGSFSRSFWIPTSTNARAARATFNDGLLTLSIPRSKNTQSEAMPRAHVRVEAA